MADFHSLSDAQLLAQIEDLARKERERMPVFLACLGEADRRKLPEKRGYSSTFDYCIRRLKLSEDEAYRRIQAARAPISRPALLSAMADGRLSLTSISRIAPHVRRTDAPEIIARAEGKSTREIDALLAPLRPEPAKRDRIRTIAVSTEDGPFAVPRVEFSFRGPPALRDGIERAKELLSNKLPFGDISDVLLEIVRDYLERYEPQGSLKLSVPARGGSSIPTSIRRTVWARDGGRCSFVGPEGIRCPSRRFLELDHRTPRALGGADSLENLRLLCRPHNDVERRRMLGEGNLFTNSARAKSADNYNSAGRERSTSQTTPAETK